MTKRAKRPDVGIGWDYEGQGSNARFWCVNCEARLYVEVDDSGYPYVANHFDTNDCAHHDRIAGMWNGFIGRAVFGGDR